MNTLARRLAFLPVVTALLAGATPAARAADAEPAYEALLVAKAPAIVSVKFVLKTRFSMGGQSQDDESNAEIRGVVVDPTGLVMVANDAFDGGSSMMRTMIKQRGGELTTSPTGLVVLYGNEAVEHPAVIVARDSTLGVAFVQVMDVEASKLPAIDLAQGAEPKIGQSLFGVTRKGRGFDCAPAIDRLFVTGKIEKPRLAWSVSGAFGGMGLPVYDAGGKPVGVLSRVEASEGVEGHGGRGGMGGMMSGLAAAAEGTCVLPLAAVQKVLEQARKRVPEAVAKAKEAAAPKDGDAPKAPDAPDAPKAPEAPSAPDAPKAPDAPMAPDAPKAPESPK